MAICVPGPHNKCVKPKNQGGNQPDNQPFIDRASHGKVYALIRHCFHFLNTGPQSSDGSKKKSRNRSKKQTNYCTDHWPLVIDNQPEPEPENQEWSASRPPCLP